ncbi:helicase-like protein [Knoellia remsis]|uniref:Helicase-like protein n=1 Tax=Knoellia remsis TaxID=407159 RepID=A0A2T0U2T6_9MICO|nr:DEAD/DEAH box helicase [Knoellia remsis]PRY52235.1 helicase-like protein [Knoellia remsis]
MKRAERKRLSAILSDLRGLVDLAGRVRQLASHMPVSHRANLDEYSLWLLRELDGLNASGDLERAATATASRWFSSTTPAEGADRAANRLTKFHTGLGERGDRRRIEATLADLQKRASAEWDQLNAALADVDALATSLRRVLDDESHLTFTTRVLSVAERTLIEDTLRDHAPDLLDARQILDPATCPADRCSRAHAAVARLLTRQVTFRRDGVRDQLDSAASRVATVLRTEEEQAQRLIQESEAFKGQAGSALALSGDLLRDATARFDELRKSGTDLALGSTVTRLIPIGPDAELATLLTSGRDFRLAPEAAKTVSSCEERVSAHLTAAATHIDTEGQCSREPGCQPAHAALSQLRQLMHAEVPACERILTAMNEPGPEFTSFADDSLPLAHIVPAEWRPTEVIDNITLTRLVDVAPTVTEAEKVAKAALAEAKRAAEKVRAADIELSLRDMDLEVLKKAAGSGGLRTGALSRHGLRSVWDVLRASKHGQESLATIPGIGDESSWLATQAALRLHEGVRDETPVRIDVKARRAHTTTLLARLRAWDGARKFEPSEEEVALSEAMRLLFNKVPEGTELLAGTADPAPSVRVMAESILAGLAPTAPTDDVWTDFLSRPADYFGMLTELGFVTEDEQKMHGDLPEEIIAAVRDQELNRTHLTASLRAYQGFGARFALVQKRIVLGDEMGLGKTVEALAVMAHLRATEGSHFVVVCPAAVVSNWMREIPKHTALRAYRVHGQDWDRRRALSNWSRDGGVAVTTYGLMQRFADDLATANPSCAVFDEAHYIKNPFIARSIASEVLIDAADHAILMTGTPLENSVQEFRNLIGYLRPDLAESAPEFLASKFRKHVAPAYLRRNQEDVLTELPELVEVDEWVGSNDGGDSYRDAVRAGDFMLMRRTAMLVEKSVKVERLKEIVEEAEDNGRRVIVFSYFRDVLTHLANVLPGQVFGPLTGAVSADERQRMVDRFSEADGGAVLVAQITAGGVGLNIQSASVVVICEPQLKPTTEDQAVARAHRMGQTTTVQVHRLLTEGGVDERIREILAEKRQLFDEFARDSVIAKRAPDAVDMTDSELARQVIAAERERLFGEQASAVSGGS